LIGVDLVVADLSHGKESWDLGEYLYIPVSRLRSALDAGASRLHRDDIAAAARNALAAGAKLEGELPSFNWGRQATMSDPFGHGPCFVQWLGKGYGDAP